jgi:serine/threonine protein kinase/tetratricopeptide (TPR) repeat protein
MTTADRWRTLSPYLDEALNIEDAEARAAWLKALHQRHPAIAVDVRLLLDDLRAVNSEGFLEQRVPLPGSTGIDEAVGAYRIVSPIGDGGMGSVWLAERSDGRFDRRVAVKFLAIALTGRGEDRFRREGRILARLAHPHIAQLLDAGVSSGGRPYLMLEYVDGEPIDRYCDSRALDVDRRVELFVQILDAVAHAHANLIVHRDIKPTNVLVTGDGNVKLLDFGIAKLLEDDGRPEGLVTQLTRDAGAGLTPAYAAPEQLTNAPITTATDIYALGVLLYVVLTGQHPAGEAQRSPADLVKAIVDTEQPRPSNVVTGSGAGSSNSEARAHARATTPERLRRSLRGDLDTIIGKAMKKLPDDRYRSVTAFAEDLRRYLHHETISAKRDSVADRAAKFVRRHRLPVAAFSLAVAALVTALIIVNRERLIAERRFAELRQLSNKVFELDKAITGLPGSTAARQRLVQASLEYLEGLAHDVGGDVDLARELADAYWRVARVQGVPTEQNLGDFAAAKQSLAKADHFAELVLESHPRDVHTLNLTSAIANDEMILADSEHRPADVVRFASVSSRRMEMALAVGGVSEAQRSTFAAFYANVALASLNQHRYEDATIQARRELEIARSLRSDQYRIGTGLSLLASALRFQGDLTGALAAIEEARTIAEQATYHTETTRMIELYGVLIREGQIEGEDRGVSLDRSDAAIATFERAFDLTEAAARKDPKDVASRSRVGTAGRELANVLRHRDPQRALLVYDTAIARLSEAQNVKARRDRAVTLAESSYALRRLNRGRDATRRIEAAIAVLKDTHDFPTDAIALDSPLCVVLRAEADDFDASGDAPAAARTYRELLAKIGKAGPHPEQDLRDATALSHLYRAAASLSARTGDLSHAEELESARLSLWQKWNAKLPGNAFVQRQLSAGR